MVSPLPVNFFVRHVSRGGPVSAFDHASELRSLAAVAQLVTAPS